MDIILIIFGIFLAIIGGAINNPEGKKTLKIIGAFLILIGGLWFVFSFIQGYNAAIMSRIGK